jgi:hypothetical protein
LRFEGVKSSGGHGNQEGGAIELAKEKEKRGEGDESGTQQVKFRKRRKKRGRVSDSRKPFKFFSFFRSPPTHKTHPRKKLWSVESCLLAADQFGTLSPSLLSPPPTPHHPAPNTVSCYGKRKKAMCTR